MDEETKEYREQQFAKLSAERSKYRTSVKFMKLGDVTKWFDITDEELEQIKAILTGK